MAETLDPRILEALECAGRGDGTVLGELLEEHRPALARMVRFRLHPELRGRFDVDDVVQESYLEITRRSGEYLANPRVPFGVWIRLVTGQKVAEIHRRHLGTRKRDPRLEAQAGGVPAAGSEQVAWHIADTMTGPATAVAKAELRQQVLKLLDELEPLDREVLVLRHFEDLSNREVALELGITPEAASKRYVRALQRLVKAFGPSAGVKDDLA